MQRVTNLYKKQSTVERILKDKTNPKIYTIYHYFFGEYEV